MQTNQIQIDVIENEPRVSAMVIADNTNIKYESIRDLIRKYKDELESFGEIPFTDFKSAKQTQGRIKQVAELNEQQSTLLITFLKNTKEVVAFKVNLVKAFFIMKEKLEGNHQPNNTNLENMVVKTLENMSASMQIQTELMRSIKSDTYVLKKSARSVDYVLGEVFNDSQQIMGDIDSIHETLERNTRYIDSYQTEAIRDKISKKASEIEEDFPYINFDNQRVQKDIYTYMNRECGASTYTKIKRENFDLAMGVIDDYQFLATKKGA
jgi:phage regulator Rha-like protein